MNSKRIYLILLFLILSFPIMTQDITKLGIRGGLGTDISLGLAYGVGVNYLLDLNNNNLELGVIIFGGTFTETSDSVTHEYKETTQLFVFGMMANYLLNYSQEKRGLFYIAGIGFASISVEWEERSDTDTSLGTLLSGGGSKHSVEGSAGGSVFNLGVGLNITEDIDVRAEIPVIVTYAQQGGSSSVIPALLVTLGYRF